MQKQFMVLVALAVLAGVAGCQSSQGGVVQSMPALSPTSEVVSTMVDKALIGQLLQAYDWQLVSVTDKAGKPTAQGLFNSANKPLVAVFDKNSVHFKNTCNHIWGNYQITDGQVKVGDMASTMKLCESTLMAVDNLAPDTLVGAYTIDKPQGKLPILTISSNTQISKFQAIAK